MFENELNKINNKINIGLVGCGRISKNHIKAIVKEYKRCNLVAICDTDKNRLNNAKEIYYEEININKLTFNSLYEFSNYEDLISAHKSRRFKLDLIVLTTPSGLHPQQTIISAESKINVCTEKPMALTTEDGEKMIAACNSNNVKLFVVKQNRLNPTLQALRQQIKENKFGNIGVVAINVFWQRPQSYYDQDDWRGTKKLDGGALLNQASHYVDLLEWIVGPLEGLSAIVTTRSRSIECEDTAIMNLKWRNGALGTMAVTMIAYPKNIEGSISIIGDKGSAKVGGIALNKFEYLYLEKENEIENILSSSYHTENVYGYGHYLYYKNILDTLLTNAKPICDGNSGLSSIKIINAAYKSSKFKKYVVIN
tara:strand:- start:3590 stop:4690 length:1101 start_codon:yes stop_codon:yes gene_type:complete